MFVNTFVKSGQIVDSKEVGNNLKVYMKFNALQRDKEGDLFLKSAWINQDDNNEFASKGWYDYNHLSVLKPNKNMTPGEIAKSELARLKAIIGKPDPDPSKAVYWSDTENGAITEGYLDGENEFVKSMKSLMKSGYTFEASAAGGVYQPSERTIAEYGDKTWDRAKIQHIAICPSTEAINPETFVVLKSNLAKELGIKKGENMGEKATSEQVIIKPNPLEQFVLSSPEYAEHVQKEVVQEIQKGSLPVKYENLKNFFLEKSIPEEEASECAEIVLIKYKNL